MEKINITGYSDRELSLLVFNTESLYLQRHHIGFLEYLEELYIFTPEQKEVLIQDLEEDIKEIYTIIKDGVKK